MISIFMYLRSNFRKERKSYFMKYSILLLTILLFSTMENNAQLTNNPLSKSEFNNIQFNGITLKAIEATEGKIQLIENLMGKPLSIKENGGSIGEKTRKFIYGSKEVIVFNGLSLNQKPSITYIKANSITLKNVSISLGDNIEVFGK